MGSAKIKVKISEILYMAGVPNLDATVKQVDVDGDDLVISVEGNDPLLSSKTTFPEMVVVRAARPTTLTEV